MRWFLLGLLPLSACGLPCNTDLPLGQIEANIDGDPWTSEATFRFAGDGLQVNTVSADGWFLTFALQRTTDGATLAAAMDLGVEPIDVEVGGSSFVSVYPGEGSSYRTEDHGRVEFHSYDETSVLACFEFDAKGDDGAVNVRRGTFHAVLAEE